VLGWLTRLTLIMVLLAIVGFELLSIVVTRVSIEDIGVSASHQALDDYRANHNENTAFQVASAEAESQGATVVKKTFEISDESVTFKLEKVAPSLLLFRTEQTASWAHISTTVYAEPIESGGQLS
jgi:hypothetical protein